MRKRIVTGFTIGIVAVATIIIEQISPFLPFHYLVAFCFIIAALEIISPRHLPEIYLQLIVLTLATAYFLSTRIPLETIVLIFLATFGHDIFALAVGKKIGGRFFKKRPFPVFSPNKTWEGLIGGICAPPLLFLVCVATLALFGNVYISPVPAIFVAVGSGIACLGDLLASVTKRVIGMKDSGEILSTLPVFRHIEKPLSGHGGYLDRFDSVALVAAIAFLLSLF